ncbi:MAG: ribosome recycling factor [Elusimicrobia bacterium]|nr:ribosome recycling factor [Elusimicrobiota bacterium]
MSGKEIEKSADSRMRNAIETLSKEIRSIRTGRASAAILEGIRVDYYGSMLPVNQIANINIPQPRLIEIKVWDENAVQPVEKAIISSNIGLTPNTEGKVIRLNVPSLTSERREELIKRLHIIVEEFRIEIRSIRRESNEELKKLKKDGVISEDQSFTSIEKIQKMTDTYIEEINKLLSKREKEIREE